jgi:uncharacterized protein YjbI with pentapeptide repeats
MFPWFKSPWQSSSRLTQTLHSSDWREVKRALAHARQTPHALQGLTLRGVDWQGLDLRSLDLSECDLRGANLAQADLRGAKLTGARLQNALLEATLLTNADLRLADLTGALLDRVWLPDGMRWSPSINLAYFTDPLSNYYGQCPAYVIAPYIPREVALKSG